MKIEASTIFMASARSFVERSEGKEVFRAWVDPQATENQSNKVNTPTKTQCYTGNLDMPVDKSHIEVSLRQAVMLRRLLVEILSGKKVEILDVSNLDRHGEYEGEGRKRALNEDQVQEGRAGWGVQYSHTHSYYEKQDVTFVASGIIKTADGNEIDFSLRLNMSREFVTHHRIEFRAGDAVLMDPLVVNFSGKAAELANLKFAFDLDSDGSKEELPMIGPGSGFLALDLNNDGVVTNGMELFGPCTGNGFAELSKYDEDHNNWIDEHDPVYDRLSFWTPHPLATPSLTSLKDKGVGAIYLGHIASQFDLKGDNNKLLGKVSDTGIFIGENGIPGTIQQLDVVA